MKTLEQVNGLISESLKETTEKLSKRESQKLARDLGKYQNAKMYLETNPNEDFVKSELEKQIARKKQIDGDFGKWLKHTPQGDRTPTQSKQAYRTEMGYKKVKAQIAFMEFILS